MRLIDADALLKALNDYGLSYRADINGMIMQAPTIAPSGDLVSRQDVIEALCRSSVYAWSIEQDQTAHNWALNIIKALPSAEAEEYDDYEHATLVDIKEPLKVEVVRCKECIYGEERIGKYRCHRLDEDWDIRFPSTHYCAWGERND